ncbi:MAG: PEP-CTERM sorting domain-containing protein [Rhodospirillales bacterium]|nr:PEP-CTERM sorting domain-containing protein [Rhodospirillales bacterium]
MSRVRVVFLALIGLFALAISPTAAMAGFTTTLDWSASTFPLDLENIDRAVFEWSGVDGNSDDRIDQTELQDWVLKIIDSSASTVVFTDIIVDNGVVQPIGGVGRLVSNIDFRFNILDDILESWDNDIPLLQSGSSGTTFNLYGRGPPSPSLDISKWLGGNRIDAAFDFGATVTQSTVRPAPEPGTLAIFGLGLAGLGLMRRRRKAAWRRHAL